MTGLFWSKDNSEFAATDAHKLKWISAPKSTKDIIIPSKVFLLPEGHYEVYISDRNIQLECDDFTATFRLIDGNYPNYRAVIPEGGSVLKLEKKEFTECLNDALICANKTTNRAVLYSSGILVAEDLDENKYFKAILESTYKGDGITIGFNARLMLECIKSIE